MRIVAGSLLVSLDAPVGHVLDLVDPHDPVLRRVSLLHHVELKVLVADLCVAHPVVTRRLA